MLGICKRPLKSLGKSKQSDKGPRWVKDKAVFWCKCCNTDFSVVVRKHHCRHCGHVFCSHCCSNKRTLIKYGYLKPVRLCNKCNGSCFKADLLLNAVGLNDLNTVTKICEEGCDVHFTTTIFPALTIAANRGSSDMCRLLLRYGADASHAVPATDSGTVVQCSRCGRTQAAGTIKDNQYECTYCGTFTRHADASDSDHTGITALHAAVQKEGHLDVVVALLENGAEVDASTAKGNTPLMYACAGGHMECTGVLLEYGASPNIKSDVDSDTPVHKAVREGHLEVVRLLVTKGADLSIQNIAGLTPQALAERCKRSDIAAVVDPRRKKEAAPKAAADKAGHKAPRAEQDISQIEAQVHKYTAPVKPMAFDVPVLSGQGFVSENVGAVPFEDDADEEAALGGGASTSAVQESASAVQEEVQEAVQEEEGFAEPVDIVHSEEHVHAEELLKRLEEQVGRVQG
ncbi:ankyrin repeat-containing domain protein [Baffinella frigidus]|nr:ankyrin repeat-containing domain protein [Cryptophyta sp. CCMP2293]